MSGQQAAPRSISKPPSTTNTKSNRLPAPTLFVGPPSLNASQISISRNPTPDFANSSSHNDKSIKHRESNNLLQTNTTSNSSNTATPSNSNNNNSLRPGRTPLERTRSGLSYRTTQPAASDLQSSTLLSAHNSNTPTASNSAFTNNKPNNANQPSQTLQIEPPLPVPGLRKPSDRSLDAKWRDMQLALNEVELTAQSTTQVFDARHASALDELRRAQIDLAHAWGRGNERAGSTAEAPAVKEVARQDFGANRKDAETEERSRGRARAATQGSASTVLTDESVLSDESAETGAGEEMGRMEDETAQDIRLAGERRAANEAYFRDVDRGVKDVVAKLQAVAAAMKGVEAESRSLWSRSDSELTSSTEDSADRTSMRIPTVKE